MNEFEKYPALTDFIQEYASFGRFSDWSAFLVELNKILTLKNETEQASLDGWGRDELIRTITAIPLSVLKDDWPYFKAGNDKRFVAFKWENGIAILSIREDGDTRTVFSGTITTIADFKKVWQLTI